MSLSPGQEALIADRLRIWHVRRACQVAALYASEGGFSVDSPQQGDAALDALLRCLVYELSGDIAAVTLLDRDTQYFLAVVPRSALHDPHIIGDTRKWYGCHSISHSGGLCVRTITMQDDPSVEPVFEIFDLTDGHTRELPVVDGTAASFRHYIGVPLTIRDGQRIGTLFVFKDKPARQSLCRTHRHFMHETARQIVDQIYLNLQALESRRAIRCNSAVLSFLSGGDMSDARSAAQQGKTETPDDPCSYVYQHAAELLSHSFDFEGVVIQEIPWSTSDGSSRQPRRARPLGYHSKSEEWSQCQLSDSSADHLLNVLPSSGAVCHLLSESDGRGTYAVSVPGGPEFSTDINIELFEQRTMPEQFMFLPLLNTYHHRQTAFLLGWAAESTRVYASDTDLLPLSAFGMAIMSQVRRIEEQILDRKKDDFLGSVSHEMRSPLHGVMACIDLARETESPANQLELLDSASSCALQLSDNIDNLLTYAKIGSPGQSRELPCRLRFPNAEVGDVQAACEETSSAGIAINLMTFIEEIVAKEESKSKSVMPANKRRADSFPVIDPTWHTIVIVDSTPDVDLSIAPQSDVGIIVSNLLSNCLKFTGSAGCVRVSLEADSNNISFLFTDSAGGIPLDFVNHKLFEPFAQQDPLDPGMGLGLSLVNSAVQRLGGKISFHTDEAEGTDFTVFLPRDHFTQDVHDKYTAGALKSSEDVADYSTLNVQFLPPVRWKSNEEDPVRDERCLDAFVASLTRTLSAWCTVDLQLYAEPWSTSESVPDVIFLLHSDLDQMFRFAGDSFADTRKVVFCPDEAAETQVQDLAFTMCTTILGPVLPQKIVSAMSGSSKIDENQMISLAKAEAEAEAASDSRLDETTETCRGVMEAAYDHSAAWPEKETSLVEVLSLEDALPPIQPTLRDRHRDPKLLLVDDNAINLKVLEMFAKKCSKLPAVSAGGGMEAIEEFKVAHDSDSGLQAFDIILLDLSMPEVSGFDVAASVRELESHRVRQKSARTYIVALTGLVSDKDRGAAFAAGVDEYVTKPASLKDLQNVVESWKSIRGWS